MVNNIRGEALTLFENGAQLGSSSGYRIQTGIFLVRIFKQIRKYFLDLLAAKIFGGYHIFITIRTTRFIQLSGKDQGPKLRKLGGCT